MKKLSDKELAVAIPTAFPGLFKDAIQHDWSGLVGGGYRCAKCGKEFDLDAEYRKSRDTSTCTVPTPITIDWNVAHKVARECDKYAFDDAMGIVYGVYVKDGIHSKDGFYAYRLWLTHIALPIHYLRAALLAVKAANQ